MWETSTVISSGSRDDYAVGVKSPIQFSLVSTFRTIAALAFGLAVCANALHGELLGFVVAHFAAAMLCFAIWFYRLRVALARPAGRR